MRKVLLATALVTMIFGPAIPAAGAPTNAYAATKNARAAALAD